MIKHRLETIAKDLMRKAFMNAFVRKKAQVPKVMIPAVTEAIKEVTNESSQENSGAAANVNEDSELSPHTQKPSEGDSNSQKLIENGEDEAPIVADEASSKDINNEANMNLQNNGVVDYSSRDSE